MRVDLATRFWSKVDKNGPVPGHRPELGRCWLWTAGVSGNGYGAFWHSGRQRTAHVVAYELAGLIVETEMELDHLCRVRICVNQTHLEPVPHRINMARSIAPCAAVLLSGVCKRGHEFAGVNIYVAPNGERQCRACYIELNRQRHRRSA
jgi:hypothetical protein